MDELISRKNAIFKQLIRLKDEGNLRQEDSVDLRQEFEKCNHIMNHMIRGYVNPAGKLAALAVFGGLGLSIWLSSFPNKTRILTGKNIIMFVPFVVIPLAFSVQFAKRRLGDRKEAKRFTKMRNDSFEIDEKFYEIIDNLKKSDFKEFKEFKEFKDITKSL
jgi:hypothetical protein